ncbi:MAG: diacylglycerol kinase [Helicobacteraceae bacterium]|nr:diacylglycerol kinase [Helicobacteraceae bacterium]
MKPKYNFFKNTTFALAGIRSMLKNEMAFKIELCVIIPAVILSLFLEISLLEQMLLICVLVGILIAECFNSAIEACVDLCTQDFHPLAKIAKDCASAGVFFSIALALIVWGAVLFNILF